MLALVQVHREVVLVLLLHLDGSLGFESAPLLFFDLLQSFQEELLDVRSLVEDHLTQGFQVGGLLDLQLVGLCQRTQFFVLFSDYLFVLELYKFTFLFEVLDNLAQVGLQQVNLRLEHFDLLILLKLLDCHLLVVLHEVI